MMIKLNARKSTAAIIAAGLAATLCVPAMAFATTTDADSNTTRDTAEANVGVTTPASSVATGAATRAAMPSLEILGINSVEESGQFVTMNDGVPQYSWSQPKYYLVASGFNASPSYYLYNLAHGGTPAAVYNSARNGDGSGPDAALAEYDTDNTDDAVWDFHPTVVVGDGNGVDYSKIETGESYELNPGVNYVASSYSTLINTMSNIAGVATNGRYGSTAAIATQYANYINNTISYINNNKSENRDFVLVTGVSGSSADNYIYTVDTTQSTASQPASDGTAAVNRYFETASKVADNYGSTVSGGTLTSAQMKAALANGGIDLIMVGGQQSSSNFAAISSALANDNLMGNTYLVENNGSQGAMYGVVMNSVENAQNIGRIYGCLYPELIDQDAFVAYYYREFYHISDAANTTYGSSDLAYVISQAMDGVRNWDATDTDNDGKLSIAEATQWRTSDVTDITAAQMTTVENIVNYGSATAPATN